MRDQRNTDGTALGVVLALVMIFVLLAGGAAVVMWRHTLEEREQAAVEAAQARAEAARAKAETERLAQATRTNHALPEPSHGTADDPESIEASIRAVLQSQQHAWNNGDIDQFMESYWKSEHLTFSSGGKVTRTWQDTLDNYKERYPSRRDMGKLSFGNLEVTPLSGEAALVLGEWQLRRDSDELGGNFTLLFRRLGGNWVIVHDHTSRAEQR